MRLLSIFLIFVLSVANLAYAAPPPAGHFGKLPMVFDGALSPDAKQIAVIINHKGDYMIRISNVDNIEDNVRAYGLGEGVKPEYIKWANNNRVIVSFWQSEKIGLTPIRTGYLFSLDTASMVGKILVDPRKAGRASTGSRMTGGGIFRQFNNIVIDWLETDPEHILMSYSDTDNNNLRPDLRRVNVETGQDSVVRRGMSGVQYWYTDLSGTPRIGQGRRDNNKASWVMRIKPADSNDWGTADDYPGLSADTDIHGFTSNPNELIISAYQGKDTVGLYVYDLSTNAITRKIYHNDEYDATGVVLSKNGDEIIGAKYTADTPETEMIGENDTILEAMRRKFDGYTVDFIDQSQSGETVLFKVSSPYDPGALLIVDGSSDKPRSLAFMRPDLPTGMLGAVVSVKYTARDGQKIPAYVTLPPTIEDNSQLKDLPFIILPHGGPYGRDVKRFDYFAQFFASRGYGVLQMNFRGSAGYGKTYKDAGRKNWIVMQEDVEDGTRWLFEKDYADPARTCIAGWSYGGYAALMGAAKNSELYNCAIAMAAVTDIKDLMRDRRKYRFGRASAKRFIGDGFENKDDIKTNSPVKIAEDMTVPLFLAHGTDDQAVHFDQFKRMKRALKKSKAKVTYMEFEDEDHYLSNEKNRIEFFKGLDKFLLKHNGKSEFAP